MHFKEIKIKGWQQFSNVFIEFDQNLTVITGANGSGKTTILNILAMHHNWPFQSLATPQKDKKGVWKYLASLFGKSDESDSRVIGSISYSDNTQTHLSVPAD